MRLEDVYYAAGIGSFIVGLFGLVGLICYALDTRKMRVATQQQEAAFTPCVLLVEDPKDGRLEASLLIKNFGSGAALNIRWRLINSDSWTETSALGAGEVRRTILLIKDVINGEAFECAFESLNGTKYFTRSGFNENARTNDLRHQFRRLPLL
jgi:hypothetical protein